MGFDVREIIAFLSEVSRAKSIKSIQLLFGFIANSAEMDEIRVQRKNSEAIDNKRNSLKHCAV